MNGGNDTVFSIKLSEGSKHEKRQLVILTALSSELRRECADISEEDFDLLLEASSISVAIKRGMNALAYSACSEKKLIYKLTAKGIPREHAAAAAKYLVKRGYIRENDDAAREAERSLAKHWGRKRIAAALFEKGYSAEAIAFAMSTVDEVDFSERCAELIKKKFPSEHSDPSKFKSIYAHLLRYGYSTSEIKSALLRLANE